jgi:two-component system, NtrC family, sensor kinase
VLQQSIQDGGSLPEEERRLLALQRYGLLTEAPEPEYDAIVRLASELLEVPIALVSLVDRERLWLKANIGLQGVTHMECVGALCGQAIQQDGLFVIEDAQADARFLESPCVRGEPHVRFYAASPLRTEDGYRIGALCVIDRAPRKPGALQLRALEHLGRQLETHLRLRLELLQARERNAELEQARARLHALDKSLGAERQERRRLERQLHSQQELLTNVLTHIPLSVFWKDREGAFLGCNDLFAHQLGRSSSAEIIGRTDHDFELPPEQIQAFRKDDQEVMDSGQPKLDIEEPIRGADGTDHLLLTSKVPLRDPAGKVWAVLGLFVDITERRNQEDMLQQTLRQMELYAARLEALVYESRQRTRRLMEASQDAVFVLDEVGSLLEINPVVERLLGSSAQRLLGTPFDALAPESERIRLRKALGDLLTRGTMHLDDQGLRSADGRRVALQLIGSLEYAGEYRRLLVIAHDLTEQRRLEHQSIQNERLAAMGVLAAGIAHEINNPTAYVLSNLDFLRHWWDDLEHYLASQPPLPSELKKGLLEARQLIADCIDGCSRIHDIVRGMRHLSHLGQEEAPALLDVHTSLDAVLHIAQGELKHTARLEKEYDPGLPLVLGNEGRVGQVFLNLIINAVHAMRPGTPEQNVLRLRTLLEAGRVRVDISDTGHGIPPEALPRIFDPFFTTKPAGIGTGLGLSISHAIIQKMGGEMRVESQPGRGTTFSVLLPPHAQD